MIKYVYVIKEYNPYAKKSNAIAFASSKRKAKDYCSTENRELFKVENNCYFFGRCCNGYYFDVLSYKKVALI